MSTACRLITPNRMMSKDDGIIFRELRRSFDGPRSFSFAHDIRFDQAMIDNGDKVSLVVNGRTMFSGWVVDHDPALADQSEVIEYRAVGPRARLAT